MFKHPKCGGRHETVAEAKQCESGAVVRTEMDKFYGDGEDFQARVIGKPDQDAWSSADRERSQFTASRPASKLTQDGMYRDPSSGRIWKVQFNRASGDGRRLYAKALVVDVEPSEGVKAEIHFAYAPGAMREIRPEWRMDLEEAKKWGALYGTCVYGHPLTKESSIKRGMGDKCWEKYGGGNA